MAFSTIPVATRGYILFFLFPPNLHDFNKYIERECSNSQNPHFIDSPTLLYRDDIGICKRKSYCHAMATNKSLIKVRCIDET